MPEGLDDCISAVNYIIDHAAEPHIDGNHITIGGDSSGGNLALATAVHQHGQSRALEFLHHIKNPAEGNDVLVFYSYLCPA
jgi:acetyl esterase/lipase